MSVPPLPVAVLNTVDGFECAIASGSRSTLLCPGPLRTVRATRRGTRLKQALMAHGLVAEVRGWLRRW